MLSTNAIPTLANDVNTFQAPFNASLFVLRFFLLLRHLFVSCSQVNVTFSICKTHYFHSQCERLHEPSRECVNDYVYCYYFKTLKNVSIFTERLHVIAQHCVTYEHMSFASRLVLSPCRLTKARFVIYI